MCFEILIIGSDSHNASFSEYEVTASEKTRGPTVKANLGISRNFPRRLSMIRILTILMYLAIFIPSIALLGFDHHIDFSVLIGTMILVVTILISLAVYAMDKTFLHEHIAMQIIIILFLFVAEIGLLYIFF
ncbi:MAG: hypothetical protein PVF58_08180 [Candidatus Methanofastidiosia archaeon]|jgi:hypothetical protein